MSYTSAYANKPPNAKGAGIAIGIHALVAAGIMSLPGLEFPDRLPSVLETYDVKPDDPPPPKPTVEPDRPEVDIPRNSKVDIPRPLLPSLPAAPDNPKARYADLESNNLGGTGDFPILPLPTIEPAPDPVIVEAGLNTRFVSQFQPRYPSGMLRLEQEGIVRVRILVGTDGRAKDVQLISTPHKDFWDSTRRHALKKWRFKPATRDGRPYESWITLKVKFEINESRR